MRSNFKLSSALPNPGQVHSFKIARKLNCVWLLVVTSAERTPLLLLSFRVQALLFQGTKFRSKRHRSLVPTENKNFPFLLAKWKVNSSQVLQAPGRSEVGVVLLAKAANHSPAGCGRFSGFQRKLHLVSPRSWPRVLPPSSLPCQHTPCTSQRGHSLPPPLLGHCRPRDPPDRWRILPPET